MRRNGLVVGDKWREPTRKVVLSDESEELLSEETGALKLCVWFHGQNKQIPDLMGKKCPNSISAKTVRS